MDTTLLGNNLGPAIATAIITLIGFSIKILKGAFDFHYEYFTRRHLRRITDLLPQVEPNSLQHGFLKQAINAEVFKIASGVKTTNRDAAALMHLCKYTRISPNQVKQFARHIDVNSDGHVAITINKLDKVTAFYSVGSALVILGWGGYAFITSFAIQAEYGWVAGAIMFLISSFIAGLFLRDFRSYRVVQRVRNELRSDPIPICEDCHSTNGISAADITTPTQTESSSLRNPGHAGAFVARSTAQIPQPSAAHPAADPSSA